MKIEDFTIINYIDRQLVIFVDDAMYEAKLKAEKNQNDDFEIDNYIKILRTVLNPFASLKSQIKVYKSLFEDIVSAFKKTTKDGIKINFLPKSIIPNLKLLPGHPREKVIYAGHPIVTDKYIPLADFHRITFEHKFSEILSLLMHLGATDITVEHISGWGKEFSAKLSVPLTSQNINVDANINSNNKIQKSIIYNAKLKGSDKPIIPENLVWYDFENTWQKIAEGRLKFGLENFNLNLQYNDDFGINTDFITKIKDNGFQLGGSYEKHISTNWKISGNFKNN